MEEGIIEEGEDVGQRGGRHGKGLGESEGDKESIEKEEKERDYVGERWEEGVLGRECVCEGGEGEGRGSGEDDCERNADLTTVISWLLCTRVAKTLTEFLLL